MTCLTERELRVGHRQKVYLNTYALGLAAAIKQSVRRFDLFLKLWEQDELYMTPAQCNSHCVV